MCYECIKPIITLNINNNEKIRNSNDVGDARSSIFFYTKNKLYP